MRTFRWTFTTMLALAVLVGMAGCGGDNEAASGNGGSTSVDGSAAADTGTPDTFAAETEKICQEGAKRIKQESRPLFETNIKFSERGPLVKTFVFDMVIPNIEQEIEEIRALEPPPGDSDEVNAILLAMEDSLDEARQDPLAFVDNPTPFAQSEKLANQYGLRGCGGA